MPNAWVIKEKSNNIVTEYYLDIISQAIEVSCDNIYVVDSIFFNSNRRAELSDFIIVASIIKSFYLIMKGYKNVIVWMQGLLPEESYLRRRSKVRKGILNYIERSVLSKARFLIFVSNTMQTHYERKYKCDFTNKYYIMPCFNTGLSKDSFFEAHKYTNNVFVYAGSLSPWQGFDRIVDCYKKIEKLGICNTKLLVLTQNQKEALEIIQKSEIINYEIGYVEKERLSTILSNAKFGFLIRDNNIVNQVATPTKLSTYMGNGIIPIYSSNIKDYHLNLKELKYKLVFDSPDFYTEVHKLMVSNLNPQLVYCEYSELFKTYFNAEYHKKRLKSIFRDIF